MTKPKPRIPLPTGDWRLARGGRHMVSAQGEVWSLHRQRIIEGSLGKRGYRVIQIAEPGRRLIGRPIHILVAEAFLGPRPDGMEVRLLIGDKLDNRLENLTYGTHAQNMADVMEHGQHVQANKTHCIHGHEFTPENTLIRRNDGGRQCKACDARRGDVYRASERGKATARARYLRSLGRAA